MQKSETSKRLLWLSWALFIALLAALLYGIFFTEKDMAVMSFVFGSDGLVTGAVTGFYLWKAKNENRSKHAMALVRELADKYGIDGAARIAEIVLKE